LEADAFIKVLTGHADLYGLMRSYSTSLLNALMREPPESITDVSALLDHETVVAAMPVKSRMQMSSVALEMLRQKKWAGRIFQQQGMQDLETEVEMGECDLVVDRLERVHRVVSLVAVRLERDDGRVLAEIGKCTRGRVELICNLPGTKVKVGELPQDAIQRLLVSRLQAISVGVTLGNSKVDASERPSKRHGVVSKYWRTLFMATLKAGHVENAGKVLQRRVAPDITSSAPRAVSQTLTMGMASRNEAFYFVSDLQAGGSICIYAWLSEHDLEHCMDPSGEAIMSAWVGDLVIEELSEPPAGTPPNAPFPENARDCSM